MLSAVDAIDANADAFVEVKEVAAYYGLAAGGSACVKPPLNVMGIKLGGGQPC
jgi:hypothetical protein